MSNKDRELLAQLGHEPLQNLRALAAHVEFEGSVPTHPSEVKGSFLEKIHRQELAPKKFAHLILHSDCDGFYVPVDFELKRESMLLQGLSGTA